MKVLVVGGGAVGSLLAWALSSGGREVHLVRRHVSGPVETEVTVADPRGARRTARLMVIGHPSDLPAAPDMVVFAVKMYDLADAVASCAEWPRVPALTVQNGVGAEELVAARRPEAGLIAGSVTASVEPADGGDWRQRTRGGLGLAPVRGAVEPVIADLGAAFTAGGFRVRRFDDAAAMKWSKLLANLSANATSAILDLDAAAIYRHRGLFAVERGQALEALAVMERLGLRPLRLPGANVRLLAFLMRLPPVVGRPVLAAAMARARGGKDPSLRVHLRSGGGRSEVDWLTGAVVRAGERSGIPTPTNRRLTELVAEVSGDPGRWAWFRRRPDRLLEAIATDT
jgi:2-dehydropantoate 2-reductase